MILENKKLLKTFYTLTMENNGPKTLSELICKIAVKQKEPFAQIFVMIPPPYIQPVMEYIQTTKLKVKNMVTDNQNYILEF